MSLKANREYSFAEFREMQSDTGISYNFQDVVMPSDEGLVFLRTYMIAVERVKEDLRQAVCIPCTLGVVGRLLIERLLWHVDQRAGNNQIYGLSEVMRYRTNRVMPLVRNRNALRRIKPFTIHFGWISDRRSIVVKQTG